MAEETEAAPEEKKSGGGKGLLIVLILLIVLLLGAVGGLGYLMYSKGMFASEEEKAAMQQEEQKKVKQESEDGTDAEYFNAKIDSLVLNITDAKGRAKLMKLSFTLKTTEPTIEAIVEANKDQIIDSVIRQVSARSSEELLTVSGKAMLKEEMLEEINNILNESTNEEEVKRDSLKNIYFTTFVIK
jgi:flagellar FliL protein